MENKKLYILTTIIVAIILVSSSIYWFYLKEEESKDYYSMDELSKKIYKKINDEEELNRSSFRVKDEVTWIDEIKIPNYSFERSSEEDYYNLNWSTDSSVTLLAVGFKSTDDRPVFFKNYSHYNFEPGKKIQIKLPVKEFHSFSFYGGQGVEDIWKTVEPFYYTHVVAQYSVKLASTTRDFQIVNTTSEVSIYDNETFSCNITFNSISNFHPFPANWGDVEYLGWRQNGFFDENLIYDKNGDLLGDLKNNRSWEKTEIKAGQKIEIEGNLSDDPDQSVQINIAIYAFPDHLGENSYNVYVLKPIVIEV